LAILAFSAAPALALPAQFGGAGEGSGEFSEPRGIAVEQETGDVYVSDRENHRVDKFDAEGHFLLAWGWGVADGKTEALQTCVASCFKGLRGSGSGQFFLNEGIAVDNGRLSSSHGDVYVQELENGRVQKFGPQGEFLLMFGREVNATPATIHPNICLTGEACRAGSPGTGPGEFQEVFKRSIAVDPTGTGTVYVGDRERVQRFNEAGAVTGQFALPGAGLSENLAVDSAEDIYVKSSELSGVRKYDPAGKELVPPRDEGGTPEHQEREAIAIGPVDELFVNDFNAELHHIFAFNPGSEQTASFDRGGLAQDGGSGIAYSEFAKALYVLTQGAVRILTQPPAGPLVIPDSEASSEVEPASAKLGALVNPEERASVDGELKYHFDYGTSSSYGTSTTSAGSAGGSFEDRPVTAALSALAPSTVYHFRVVAENAAKEIADGPDQTFATLPPVSIDSTSVSRVDATSARLQAELNPRGRSSEYRFEYLTDAEFRANGESFTGVAKPVLIPGQGGSVGSGKTDTTVENLIQELLPSTTYHYRVVARNALNQPGEYVIGPERSFTTQGPASILADGRQWEMVSPPNKHGSPLEPLTEEGGLIQTAPNGGAFAYVALGPINGEAKGVRSPDDSQLLATRGPSGWSTQDITTPHEEISIIHVGFPSEYQFFAEDLSASAVQPEGVTPLSSKASERTPYRREADGQFVALVTRENTPPGAKYGGSEGEPGNGQWGNGVEFRTATPDLSQMILEAPQILAPGFQPGFEDNGEPNLYELAGGKLTLVSVLPSGNPASEAGLGAGVGRNNLNMRGALSNDGSRVVFETNAGEHLYLRDIAHGQTVQLDEPQLGAGGGTGAAEFQVANSDASKIFFTDTSRLTTDSKARSSEPDLYMCEVHESEGHPRCTLSDLSVDPNAGEVANVQGEVSAIDASGEHVYFAANGVLTSTPNARGEVAVPGVCNSAEEASCNLYSYDTTTDQIGLVAVLSSKDAPDWAGGSIAVLGNLTARSSPDGRFYTFMSQQSLTGYDNRDEHSGARDEEVFQLNAESGKLSCVSCDPTGARPNGVFDKPAFPGLLVDHPRTWWGSWLAGSIPGWTLGPSHVTALYQSRYLSNSGREFFNSADALVPQDTNNVNDVYEFEPPGVGDCSTASETYSAMSGGCVSLVSSGTSKEESAFLDATESGDEAFFLTSARLLGSDVDSAFDVYDAHVCTGSSPCPPPPPPPPPACQGDACQNPVAAPNDATPGSLTFHGPGNQTQAAAVKAKAKPLTRAQKLAKALKVCKTKKNRQKRATCAKTARKNFGPVKKKSKKGPS
jgi:NHL repeat